VAEPPATGPLPRRGEAGADDGPPPDRDAPVEPVPTGGDGGDVEVLDADALRGHAGRPWLNLPNVLTAVRLVLVPVILALVLIDAPAAGWWAVALFVLAALTDTVDGWAARRWHGVTRWGQLADPIADKLLIIGTLAALAALGELPWWAVIVIVLREVGVTLLRLGLISRLDVVMPASPWGKAKALSQMVAVAAFLLPIVPGSVRDALLYLAVAFTVGSGVDYAVHAARLFRAGGTGGR
jgi:CDP-diacylglycerol--glycerol-3-phosphate 3-phosphatidyltransferase